MIAYHFVDRTLRNGKPIPSDGVWLKETLPLNMCRHGLHASRHVADAIQYAPGAVLCLVELGGTIIEQHDKVVAQRRRILARFDATELLRADARTSALSVIHLWKAPDVVRQYLETGDEELRPGVRAAAYAAAYAVFTARAARTAAYAARTAASVATGAAYAARTAATAAYAAVAYSATAGAARAAAGAARAAAATRAAGVANAHRERLQIVVEEKFLTIPTHAYFMRGA
jgi:hypothetical protein